MICINCVIGQISSNLFKVDATMDQIATYRSSITINEISNLWFIKDLQIPFKLILSTFFSIYHFFEAHICQIFTIPMEVGLKWCTTTCNKILKS